MSHENIQIGNIYITGVNVRKYNVEMYHSGLTEHKIISAPDKYILNNKIELQTQKWSDKWKTVDLKRKMVRERVASLELANSRTNESIQDFKNIENILIQTLPINHKINWDKLKKKGKFSEPTPPKPASQKKEKYPPEPLNEIPRFNIFDKFSKSKKEKKTQRYIDKYKGKINQWENEKLLVTANNIKIDKEFDLKLKNWEKEVDQWTKRKSTFLKLEEDQNNQIEQQKKEYLGKNEIAIVEYVDMVLTNSTYPDSFPKNYEIEYNPNNKILILEYQLPSIERFPTIKEVRYIASKKELKETKISEAQLLKLFDDTMYKITLRAIHELFQSDEAKAIDAISFNGWVKSINKAIGKEENNCILSIQVQKEEFRKIDLANVDPRTCFKTLKGVASSKLSSLTPIRPILQINKEDRRFVEGYDVANQLDSGTNIAAMDWQDFEHLIRELFEKEFQSNGGEVKVTQASRDGGVDAIAFDPDPIRGGKIIIQAKRYTNTVGVDSVRDLYGTVINEGATKGILVSTADYGPDAYSFAKNKPITLLNGSNLLHLLEKHGHHAKIDLREAKKILGEKER